MLQIPTTTPTSRFRVGSPMLYLAILFILVAVAALACGVKSGDRRAARSTPSAGEFHRSPVAAFEQLRVDLVKNETGCSADPADITLVASARVRLAIQLAGDVVQSQGGSTAIQGERDQVIYSIQGLAITGSAGAWGTGVTEVNIELDSGARKSYDFNTGATGAFDIMCDDKKIGTFTVTEG